MKLNTRMVWSLALALALAGIILWANLSWAQYRGGGGPGALCPVNQTPQNTVQGQGQGNANCPNYPGYRGGRQGRGANAQGFQGQRGPGRNAPNPPASQPNATQ